MQFVYVKFDNNLQKILCKYSNIKLKDGIAVIVDTKDNDLLYGTVVSVIDNSAVDNIDSLGVVIRIASKKDYNQYLLNKKDSSRAILDCKKMVALNNLNMNILDAYYNFSRTQLMFRFVADERVDFRKLARDLGAVFKTRIELRQVGIRDKAKEIGGFGPCGRMLCCNTFLKSFDSVSINMAKNQSISLNPNKINGVCGRLLCCLKYENEMYLEAKKEKNDKNIDSVIKE